MNITRKDATIANVGADDEFPGSFEVILSTPAEDRDKENLAAEDWKQPLPEHITFDTDHQMSVAGTVGSGTPALEDGNIIVRGTYSSLPRAQDTRTLVREGHIRTTSVAFMSEKVTKDGKTRTVRELLNGAFVAIPSNREALVLSSKAGARNSKTDAERTQATHDHAVALGASAPMPMDDTGATTGATGGKAATLGVKAVDGSYEQRQQAVSDALDALYHADDADGDDDRYVYAYPLATFAGSVVYRVSGSSDENGQWQASYICNADGTVELGEPARVNMVETVVPIAGTVPKGFRLLTTKDPSEETTPDLSADALAGEETTPDVDEKSIHADALARYTALTAYVSAFTA